MAEYIGQQPVYHGQTHFTGNYHHDPAHGNYGLEPHHDEYHDFKPDDHYHHDQDPNIVWKQPAEYVVPEVPYTPRRYEEYIPRFEKNIVQLDYEYEEVEAEPVFTPYNLFADGDYKSSWKPFYDAYHDELHKPDPTSAETDSDLGTSDEIHPRSDEISAKSESSESDGNYVPVLNPTTQPGVGTLVTELVLEDPTAECDCADIEAERDALKAELALLRLTYGLDDGADASLPRHGLGDAISVNLGDLVGDGSEYLHPGLDRASNYYDPALSPLNDPYYHDPTEFYAAQEAQSLHSGDPLGFFDYVVDPTRLSHSRHH